METHTIVLAILATLFLVFIRYLMYGIDYDTNNMPSEEEYTQEITTEEKMNK